MFFSSSFYDKEEEEHCFITNKYKTLSSLAKDNSITRSYSGQLNTIGDGRNVFHEYPRSYLSNEIYNIMKENEDIELNNGLIILYNIEMDRVRLDEQNYYYNSYSLKLLEDEYEKEVDSIYKNNNNNDPEKEQKISETKQKYNEKYRELLQKHKESILQIENEFYETIKEDTEFI